MATSILSGDGVAYLPRQAITVVVHAADGIGFDFDLTPSVRSVSPRPGMLVIPSVAGSVSIAIRTTQGTAFPPRSEVHVVASVGDSAAYDGERVVVDAIDVSGLARREILVISDEPAGLALRRQSGAADSRLSDLGAAALGATRSALGVERVPSSERAAVHLVIDSSASMAPVIADGSVAAAIDVLCGVSPVICGDASLKVTMGEWSSAPVGDELATLSQTVERILADSAPTTTFRVPPDRSDAAGRPVMTYVVTDGIPAEPAGSSMDRRADALPVRHLLLLGHEGAESVLRRMTAEPMSYLAGGGNSTTGARLLANPAALATLVAELVGHWKHESPRTEG